MCHLFYRLSEQTNIIRAVFPEEYLVMLYRASQSGELMNEVKALGKLLQLARLDLQRGRDSGMEAVGFGF